MIILRNIRVSRELNAKFWLNKALGTIDQYGNPFRIIKLQWIPGGVRPMTEYAKTRGFQDTEISKSAKTGGFKIKYRDGGSVSWMQGEGGIGPFEAHLALTPANLRTLASHHGDKLWNIVDADIRAVVDKMYKKRVALMKPGELEYNKKRIAAMHSRKATLEPNALTPLKPTQTDIQMLEEEKRQLDIRRQELDRREAEIKEMSNGVVQTQIDNIDKGVTPIQYSEEYVRKANYNERKSIAKELGIKAINKMKSEELLQAILQHGRIEKVEIEKNDEDDLIETAINGNHSGELDGFNMDDTVVDDDDDEDEGLVD